MKKKLKSELKKALLGFYLLSIGHPLLPFFDLLITGNLELG